jgi:glucosamine kinase
MSQLAHVLAVDGGGTKTVAVVFTVAGQELARCRVGPANLYRDPVAGLATIAAAWQQACALAGLSPADTATNTVVSAGLAGASGEAQRRAYAAAFQDFAARRLSGDGYTAFVGAFGNRPGGLLSIGTGVVAFRRAVGRGAEVLSGWGFPVADRGSGAWLGFRLAAEYLDHLDAAATMAGSPLYARAEAAFGRGRDQVLSWLAAARAADFAAFAPAIVEAAGAGDPLGQALLDEGGAHLLRLARALQPTPGTPLCLGGGLADVYRTRIEAAFPDATLPASCKPDPIRGAFLVATGEVPPEYPDVA